MISVTAKEPKNPPTPISTVLVVDDNPENRILLNSQLGIEGYKVIQANGGIQGLEIAQEHDPDIILLDVMMPDMSGFEVCKQLKQNPKTHLIPVIMVTALREVHFRIEGIEAGADEFLSRPHVREELLVRVRTLIQLKRARVRLEEEKNRLQLLNDISRAVSTQLDLDKMMSAIIIRTQTAVDATKGNIILLDEDGQVRHKFRIRAGFQVEISDHVTYEVMSRGLGGWLVRNRRGDIIDDIRKDSRWITLPDDKDETGSAIGVPLINPNRTVGVLILNHPHIGHFKKEHLALLEIIGASVTAAIENASLFNQISEERRKLEAILEQSTDAIFTTDENWLISLFNRAAERLFGIRAVDVAGLSVRQVAQLQPLVPVFETAVFKHTPEEVTLNEGKTLYVSISPIQEVGFAVVMQDVTQFKLMEQMRLIQERHEKQLVKNTFSRYMGEQLVEHVLSNDPGLLSRRERRHAVVMFADLRNWTGGMITKIEPNEAIDQMNAFFTVMMEIAVSNEGTVFELTGDEMLVGFNAPFDQPDAAYRALKTAVAMQHRFDKFRQIWYQRIGTELGLGVGLDMGSIVMGNVGAESRMSFRMVGEPMNFAHRLVAIAEDGQIIISEAIYRTLQQQSPQLLAEILFNQIGPVPLKGISPPPTLYLTQIGRTPLQ